MITRLGVPQPAIEVTVPARTIIELTVPNATALIVTSQHQNEELPHYMVHHKHKLNHRPPY